MNIVFPVRMTVNVRGNDYTKELKEGDTVRCLRCGKQIKINRFTVSMEDDLPYVTCKNIIYKDANNEEHICGHKVFALYYIEQKEKDSWKRNRIREHSILAGY